MRGFLEATDRLNSLVTAARRALTRREFAHAAAVERARLRWNGLRVRWARLVSRRSGGSGGCGCGGSWGRRWCVATVAVAILAALTTALTTAVAAAVLFAALITALIAILVATSITALLTASTALVALFAACRSRRRGSGWRTAILVSILVATSSATATSTATAASAFTAIITRVFIWGLIGRIAWRVIAIARVVRAIIIRIHIRSSIARVIRVFGVLRATRRSSAIVITVRRASIGITSTATAAATTSATLPPTAALAGISVGTLRRRLHLNFLCGLGSLYNLSNIKWRFAIRLSDRIALLASQHRLVTLDLDAQFRALREDFLARQFDFLRDGVDANRVAWFARRGRRRDGLCGHRSRGT
jgi:hypothetical protein